MVQSSKAPTVTGEWECTECGFVIEGVQARRPARCPECGAPGSALEFQAEEEDEWDEVDDDLDDEDDEDDEDLYEDLDEEDVDFEEDGGF